MNKHQAHVARRCMSLALAPHEIRVNAIGPGSIQTQVLQAVVTNKAAKHRHAFQLEGCPACCMAYKHTLAVVLSSLSGQHLPTHRSDYVRGSMQRDMHLQAGPPFGRLECST